MLITPKGPRASVFIKNHIRMIGFLIRRKNNVVYIIKIM